jgi:hypothetical protein
MVGFRSKFENDKNEEKMAKKKAQNVQADVGISGVNKIITLAMFAFMGYIFFSYERGATPPENATLSAQEVVEQSLRVKITDTSSGTESFTNLNAGKIFIGKWVLELAPEPTPEPTPETSPKSEPEKVKKEEQIEENSEFKPTIIPEEIDAPMSIPMNKPIELKE